LPRAMPGTVGAHPDADLLTAFAEQSLSKSEQGQVMEHLARCGDCREVVALALPATEAQVVPVSVRPSGGWLSWAVLRWGVVAAGFVLVTSVGVLQYQRRSQQGVALVSSAVRQEQTIAAPQAQTPAPVTAAKGAAPQAREIAKQIPLQKSRNQSGRSANQPSPSLSSLFPSPRVQSPASVGAGLGSGTGGGIGGGVFSANGGSDSEVAGRKNPGQSQGRNLAFGPASGEAMPVAAQSPAAPNATVVVAPKAAVPPSSQTVEVQSYAAQNAPADQVQARAIQGRTEPPSLKPQLNSDVVKAKDSEPQQHAKSNEVSAPAVSSSGLSLQKALRTSPQWAVSSSGGLQRSFDGGATWQDVSVGANDYKNQNTKMKMSKKEPANSGPVFRAVAALGPEVWAGGSGAMLYHSLDSGNNWTRVMPSEASASLSGDVVGMEFSDAQHGRIVTSTGEAWLTRDDGQTWHKQ